MKKKISILMVLLLTAAVFVSAQGMMGSGSGQAMMGAAQVTADEISHTKQEEAEGLEIWEKLESKELSCADLTDDDFDVLGEYFMGQSAGENHAAMNKRMTQMMGEEGETQMHISMGKSYSGCYNTTGYYGMMMGGASPSPRRQAQAYTANTHGCPLMDEYYGRQADKRGTSYPGRQSNAGGYYGMGSGMMGGGYYGMGSGMMGSYYGIWGVVVSLIWYGFWALVLIAIALVVVWLYRGVAGGRGGEKPVEILKARYAKGEITKKQFEEMQEEIKG